MKYKLIKFMMITNTGDDELSQNFIELIKFSINGISNSFLTLFILKTLER